MDAYRKPKSCIFQKQLGSAILQTIMITGIMTVIAGATISMVIQAQKEQKLIRSKVEYQSVQLLAKDIMARESECNCQVNGKVFDSTNPNATFDLSKFMSSCAPGAPELMRINSLLGINAPVVLDRLFVNNIKKVSGSDIFTGELVIDPLASETVRKIKTDPIKFVFHTDTASPPTAKVITGCGPGALTIPENLTAAPGPGGGTCTFNWDYSLGVGPITYTVRGGGTAAGSSPTGPRTCQTIDARTCSISGLTNGVNYYFAIQASNLKNGPTAFSGEVTCRPIQPASVPVLGVTESDQTCTLNWAPSTGGTPITYTVLQSLSSPVTKTSTVVCDHISPNSCVVSGLTNGTTYYFSAFAANPIGETNLSNQVSCTPCPAQHHAVGGVCIKTFTLVNMAHWARRGWRTVNLGVYHYCALTDYYYDGDGIGVCQLSGTEGGNWSISMADEGKKVPQWCYITCSQLSMTATNPTIGTTCEVGGVKGLNRGLSCCSTGTFFDIFKRPKNNIRCL